MRRVSTWVPLLAISFPLCGLCCLWLVVGLPGIEAIGHVFFGPVLFLVRVGSEITINWGGVATAGVCLVGLAFGLHSFLGWIARHRQAGEEHPVGPRLWRVRWTAAILAVVVLTFVAGIAAVGVTHQTAWLFASPEPLWEGGIADVAARISSSANLKQMGIGCQAYHEEEKSLPPGGSFDDQGRMLHGWQAFLLPYVEQHNLYRHIDLERPWDDSANAKWFRIPLRVYLNPSTPEKNAEGL